MRDVVQTHHAIFDLAPNVERAVTAITIAFTQGRKVLLCGNGGSAADAQHIAAEFVGRFERERRPFPALALTTNTSVLTAVGNDYGYSEVFVRQIEALGKMGDVLIAISTSGRSENVVRAVECARARGIITIGLTSEGSSLDKASDISLAVPLTSVPRLQECHITLGHILVGLVEHYCIF